MMVEFDKTAYDIKYNSKTAKQTLPLPDWLNRLALEKKVNFSGVLQEALKLKLGIS